MARYTSATTTANGLPSNTTSDTNKVLVAGSAAGTVAWKNLTSEQIPVLPISKLEALTTDDIPTLPAGKITGAFTTEQIPTLPANKITGSFTTDQIPTLPASKLPAFKTINGTSLLQDGGNADITISGGGGSYTPTLSTGATTMLGGATTAYDITNFDVGITYTVDIINGEGSITISKTATTATVSYTAPLVAKTNSKSQFKIRAVDSLNGVDVFRIFEVNVTPSIINKPSITAPAATNVSENPTFTASGITGTNTLSGAALASATWEIYSDAALTTLVETSGTVTTSQWLCTTDLNYGTTYYARVQYRGTKGVYASIVSEWSDTYTFKTMDVFLLTGPTPALPSGGVAAIFTISNYDSNAEYSVDMNDYFALLNGNAPTITGSTISFTPVLYDSKTDDTSTGHFVIVEKNGTTVMRTQTATFTFTNSIIVTPTLSINGDATRVKSSVSLIATEPVGKGKFVGNTSNYTATWQLWAGNYDSGSLPNQEVTTTNSNIAVFTNLVASTRYRVRVRYDVTSPDPYTTNWSNTNTTPLEFTTVSNFYPTTSNKILYGSAASEQLGNGLSVSDDGYKVGYYNASNVFYLYQYDIGIATPAWSQKLTVTSSGAAPYFAFSSDSIRLAVCTNKYTVAIYHYTASAWTLKDTKTLATTEVIGALLFKGDTIYIYGTNAYSVTYNSGTLTYSAITNNGSMQSGTTIVGHGSTPSNVYDGVYEGYTALSTEGIWYGFITESSTMWGGDWYQNVDSWSWELLNGVVGTKTNAKYSGVMERTSRHDNINASYRFTSGYLLQDVNFTKAEAEAVPMLTVNTVHSLQLSYQNYTVTIYLHNLSGITLTHVGEPLYLKKAVSNFLVTGNTPTFFISYKERVKGHNYNGYLIWSDYGSTVTSKIYRYQNNAWNAGQTLTSTYSGFGENAVVVSGDGNYVAAAVNDTTVAGIVYGYNPLSGSFSTVIIVNKPTSYNYTGGTIKLNISSTGSTLLVIHTHVAESSTYKIKVDTYALSGASYVHKNTQTIDQVFTDVNTASDSGISSIAFSNTTATNPTGSLANAGYVNLSNVV